ncbi:putative O-glycosylation ligase, exosortase A system-associated [Alishewanella tabrizica]|uniref:O-antigen polymerase n=1 Tax=Alishewanella tabrizica TaxID=671278 RepID=A0ABQ2WQJ7_9ALTE|nr:putative O-glycosylation ligase, exosortase A system-associated [Alishewanella tabrizica]GGW62659.1 O-antigen polymerase [Alishewanella tabrizica]
MRDLLLVGFLFITIYFCFKKPFLGVAAWTFIALLAPANWAFGFSNSFRLNLTVVIITLLSYLFVQKNKKLAFNGLSFWVLAFAIWTLISSFNAFNSDIALEYWNQFIRVLLLYFAITFIVTKKLHIDTLIWVIVLAISSYAAMEALKFILSGGSHQIGGRSGMLRNRNDFAVAINMCLPLILYLVFVTKDFHLKLGLWGLFLGNILAIIGTGSRGGFIGLAILALAFWLKSNRKMLWLLLAIIILPTAYQFTPEHWRERQDTIQTAATEDGSFIGRLWAWKISVMIANDNPATGGGFRAVLNPIIWHSYAPFTPGFGPISTPEIPENSGTLAAHSIYFQVLGDHGYIGFIIFLFILLLAYLTNIKNKKYALANNQLWVVELSKALNLAIIGFAITGANVSLAYFDLLYAIFGIIAVIKIYKLHANLHPNSGIDNNKT